MPVAMSQPFWDGRALESFFCYGLTLSVSFHSQIRLSVTFAEYRRQAEVAQNQRSKYSSLAGALGDQDLGEQKVYFPLDVISHCCRSSLSFTRFENRPYNLLPSSTATARHMKDTAPLLLPLIPPGDI